MEAFAGGIKPLKTVKEKMVELKGFPAATLNRDFWKLLRLWNIKWHPSEWSQSGYRNESMGSS